MYTSYMQLFLEITFFETRTNVNKLDKRENENYSQM